MYIDIIDNITSKAVKSDEVKLAKMKSLVGPDEGWGDYVMREVELGSLGYTPKHLHDWPHINYVLEGEGELFIDGEVKKIKEGSVMYVPSNIIHQYRNTSEARFRFICIVPKEGHV